jgi:prepilin-type N-terminal cleavage/methylation domain-containing protein
MRKSQKGFSLIELLIVVAIILIIAAIAIPNLLRSRIAANEASAVSSLRTLNTACITFNSTYGQYPNAMTDLQSPTSGNPTSTAADLIDQVLASGRKSGYDFVLSPGTANASYTITAFPVTVNQTGLRGFFTDQSGVIRYDVGVQASISSSPLQ